MSTIIIELPASMQEQNDWRGCAAVPEMALPKESSEEKARVAIVVQNKVSTWLTPNRASSFVGLSALHSAAISDAERVQNADA